MKLKKGNPYKDSGAAKMAARAAMFTKGVADRSGTTHVMIAKRVAGVNGKKRRR